ncbi:hypothetical protein Clacol_004150 [Clathrus columnatus]|uniref:N-acetyltransferase domain-containing protein n=1 Tax=Clathrus columnatus TaxID=1419009 RepID=A0AAV5AA89_9AGAM|nr:hypothetical protein Clacol_004150 [Clathrus columnatus]
MSFKNHNKYNKIRVKEIILSPATLKDASVMSKIYLRTFEHGPNRSIFPPRYADIVLKAKLEDEYGKLLEALAGFAHWTSPDGPRKRTTRECILLAIIFPIHNFFPIEKAPAETKCQIKEIFQNQLHATFELGGEAYNRRFWYLHMLCVDPDWQGFGIGKCSCDKAAESDSVVHWKLGKIGFLKNIT